MKRYAPYKHIRQEALIFGLPLPYFAGMMTAVVLSLLLIIFSFSFWMVLILGCFNAGGYIVLLKLASRKGPPGINLNATRLISNRQYSTLYYDTSE